MITLHSAIISKVSTMADKSLRIIVDTPEIPSKIMAEIFDAFMECDQGIEIKNVSLPGKKSPSERMRNTLYVYWERNTSKKETFDAFYNRTMDKLINDIQNKIL